MKSFLATLLLISLSSLPLFGHATGENYVFLNVQKESIDGHFEVLFSDLDEKLNQTIKGDEATLQGQIDLGAPAVHQYVRENFSIGANSEAFEIEFTRQSKLKTSQGWWAEYHFEINTGPVPDILEFEHNMFYENDSMHRALVVLDYNEKTQTKYGEENAVLVFSKRSNIHTLDLLNPPEIIWGFSDMIPEGIWHIWIGIDHILFLLALLLPVVLIRSKSGIKPVSSFSTSLWKVGKIVTVFTVAHSITLVLAAMDVVSISSRIVESIIALSIVLVALNSIFGKFKDGSLIAILILGLFHGLGFASVMGELPFRMTDLMSCVIGFNVGVELGQMAIVLALFPLLYLLRNQKFYFPVIQVGGSVVLILIASVWFVERAFEI